MLSIPVFRAFWAYKGFIFSSIGREFKSKYTGSLFGVAWNIINPLAMILVYTIIFSEVMRARLAGSSDEYAYGIYLCAGLLPWTFFAEIVTRSLNVFVESGALLKRSSFPRICLPAILVGSSILNFAMTFAIFVVFLFIVDRFPGLVIFAFFPVLLIQIAIAAGIGILFGTLNVFFRDFGQFVGIVVQFWFWFTPIVYSVSVLPSGAMHALDFNPMYPIIRAYQTIFVQHAVPDWATLSFPAVFACLALMLGYLTFRKNVAEMVDEL